MTQHQPVTEVQLRQFVRRLLQGRASKEAGRVYEEMVIEQGAARVDLALVKATRLEAFEIKSDRDDFGRLHNQIHAYNRLFDRITMVCGPALAGAALEVLPPWWGVIVLSPGPSHKVLPKTLRAAGKNPLQERRSLAMLLWREEAQDVLTKHTGQPAPKRSTRRQLHEALAQSADLGTLRRWVTQGLLHRAASASTTPAASRPNGGSLHLGANCLDSHFLSLL